MNQSGEPFCRPYRVVAVMEPNEVVRLGLMAMLWALEPVTEVVAAEDPAVAVACGADVVLVSCALDPEVLDEVRRWAAGRDVRLLLIVTGADDPRLPDFARHSVDWLVVLEGLTVEKLGEALAAPERGAKPLAPVRPARHLTFRLPGRHHADSWHRNLLTQRETDVLQLLSQGYSNKQIAPRIGISEHGVKRHVGNILAKLNCANRTEAVSYALQQNLLSAPSAAN